MSLSHRLRAALVLLLTLVLLVPVSVRTAPHARAAVAGDTKLACAYTANDVSQLQQFGWLVGRTMDCASVFNSTATSWTAWEDPWFAHMPVAQTQYDWRGWLAGGNRTLVLTQSLVPNGIESNWRALGASGAYDAYIQTLATNLVGYGMGHAIIRLAPEANGDWNFDDIGTSPDDFAKWAAYWAHFVAVMKAVPGAHFEFDWTVNPSYRPIPFSSYYPGNNAVDIVGIDQYDWASSWVGTAQPARWNYQATLPLGLNDLVAWATSNGKPLSIPEWAMVPSSVPQGMNDDPYFADQIGNLVKNNVVRYESYFNVSGPTTMRLQDAAGARAAWKRHFGTGGDAVGTTPPPVQADPPVYPPVDPALDVKNACLDENNSLSALQSFGWLTGTTMSCAVIHNESSGSWAAWDDPWTTRAGAATDNQWQQWLAAGAGARRLVLVQSLVPAGVPSDWRTRGANGEYDAYLTTLGSNLVARGMGSVTIRLSPKANADGPDNIGATPQNNADWKAYWARAVSVLRAVPGAHFTFEWTVNAGYHATPFDAYYPGDASVDVIGVTQYDSAAAGVGTAQPYRWNLEATQPQGLTALVTYAQVHGKPLAVAEWAGLSTARADGIGDDGPFADQIAAIVKSVPTSYQAYVNNGQNGQLRLQDASAMRASWKRHFGATGDAVTNRH